MGHPVQVGIKVLDFLQLVPAAPKLQENIVYTVFRDLAGCRHPKQVSIKFGTVMVKNLPESGCIAFRYA